MFSLFSIVVAFTASSYYLPGCGHPEEKEKVVPAEVAKKEAFNKEIDASIEKMMEAMEMAPKTGDPDLDFAYSMIEHHEGGIDISDIELQYGKHAEARALAQKTKNGNQASRERLLAFIAEHGAPVPVAEAEYAAFRMKMHEQMERMDKVLKSWPATTDADYDFAEVMIHHHQGAIDMSKLEMKFGKDETARKEASTITEESEMEITELGRFRREHKRPK